MTIASCHQQCYFLKLIFSLIPSLLQLFLFFRVIFLAYTLMRLPRFLIPTFNLILSFHSASYFFFSTRWLLPTETQKEKKLSALNPRGHNAWGYRREIRFDPRRGRISPISWIKSPSLTSRSLQGVHCTPLGSFGS